MKIQNGSLRIGNLVYEPKGHLHKVKSITKNSRRVRCPIPLTADWLHRMAERQGDTNTWVIDDWILLELEDDNWDDSCFDVYLLKENTPRFYLTCIDSVHHIQNLYHSFTHVELDIKLTGE